MNLAATGAVSNVLTGRPAVLHHHDLPWQRERFAHFDDLPADDRSWVHVTTTELSAQELHSKRGICATVVHNAFDVDASGGNRYRARSTMAIDPGERVLLQPTRALPRKNVRTGIALAEAVGATYWLTGAAERAGSCMLGARVSDESGAVVWERHGTPPLPRPLAPGESVVLNFEMRAPRVPGLYTLKLDFVAQHVCWFEERGSTPLTVQFRVS